MLKTTTIRVTYPIHNSLVTFSDSRGLTILDGVAELLSLAGEDVEMRDIPKKRGLTAQILDEPV
jgi:hypothetical protein